MRDRHRVRVVGNGGEAALSGWS